MPDLSCGHDATSVPDLPNGYTIRFTFHSAGNLPMSDLASRASDPFLYAILQTSTPKRHAGDPEVSLRTPTVHKSVDPTFNCTWVVANVPEDGFRLKIRVYDEDPGNHDDRLGNVYITIANLREWKGLNKQTFRIEKRSGSWRAYGLRAVATVFHRQLEMRGQLVVSAEVLGKTEGPSGRVYTLSPGHWSQSYSSLIGKIANTKHEDEKGVENFDFQANMLQLAGPVPADLYHRYVQFSKHIQPMFTAAGVKGVVLNRLLRHQHNRIYNHDKKTEYGVVPEPGEDLSKQFLKMARWASGGRQYTYVLMLDGQLRFTETGKEFGIDLLSKHTMHSNVAQYIAYSGEFFIRSRRPRNGQTNESHQLNMNDLNLKPQSDRTRSHTSEDPADYELIIDNDSGTYRPSPDLLPQLKQYLESNFTGLKIKALPQGDEELERLKKQQLENKKKTGDGRVFVQHGHSYSDSDSSISSSDEEDLEGRAEAERKETEVEGHSNGLQRTLAHPKSSVLNWVREEK